MKLNWIKTFISIRDVEYWMVKKMDFYQYNKTDDVVLE